MSAIFFQVLRACGDLCFASAAGVFVGVQG
jgi:hypothetical protein